MKRLHLLIRFRREQFNIEDFVICPIKNLYKNTIMRNNKNNVPSYFDIFVTL